MARYPCKLLTDTGEFYMIYCSTLNQFVSPTIRSMNRRIDFTNWGFGEFDVEDVNQHVFDLRTITLEHIEVLLQKLEVGESLTISEAVAVYNFDKFLEGTVADHQYDYPELSDQMLEEWVIEFGLRTRFPEYDAREIITDCGADPAFEEKASCARFKDREPEEHPTTDQNKIAARYVRTRAKIANALGPDRSMPNKIVDLFFQETTELET